MQGMIAAEADFEVLSAESAAKTVYMRTCESTHPHMRGASQSVCMLMCLHMLTCVCTWSHGWDGRYDHVWVDGSEEAAISEDDATFEVVGYGDKMDQSWVMEVWRPRPFF